MTLKIKDKKFIWTKLYFSQCYITRKFEYSFLWIKDPDPDPEPGDPKRPDLTGYGSGSGSAALL